MELQALLSAVAGLVTSETVLHVAVTGDDTDPGTATSPLRTIAKAVELAAAQPARRRTRIQLLGTDAFDEQVTLPSRVTLAGPGRIVAPAGGPAVQIVGTLVDPVRDVVLDDLDLQGSGRGYTGDGGAVQVVAAVGLKIRDCRLTESRAARGGGLSVNVSEGVLVERCTFRGNVAEGPIPAVDLVPPTLSLPAARGHGGGLWTCDSAITVRACEFDGNAAVVAGGGLAASHDLWPGSAVLIDDCVFTLNQASHRPLLGRFDWAPQGPTELPDAIREVFRETLLSEDDEEVTLSNAHGMNYETGFGGAIALRNTARGTTITGCSIGQTRTGAPAPNLARRGGGIHLYLGAYPTIRDSTIAYNAASGDGGGLGADFFDPILPAGVSRLGLTRIALIPREEIPIERCVFQQNFAIEDGGGAYFTGWARPRITGGHFVGNRAGEHGGGLRATYASRLVATGVRFTANEANVILTDDDPDTSDPEGGGGVSARNSDVLLDTCVFERNRVNRFAGGAIYYRSSFEGDAGNTGFISDEHGIFDLMQEGDFRYRRRLLRLVNCTGTGNRAEGPKGAGGFLYALRAPTTDGDKIHGGQEPFWVSIEGPDTRIEGNVSEAQRTGATARRKRGSVVIELSGQQLAPGVPADRVSIGREVPLAAIGASTPDPDGRALVVMLDGSQGNDLRRPVEGGGRLVHGPEPTVVSVDRPLARAVGGDVATITGSGFETGMRVTAGGVPANVSGETSTTVTFALPALPPGTHDVVVSLPSGAQATTVPQVRVLPPPAITEFTPARAAIGEEVVVRGRGLPVGTRVHLVFGTGGTAVEATVTQVVDDALSFVVPDPPAVFNAAAIRVTAPTGQTAITDPTALRYR